MVKTSDDIDLHRAGAAAVVADTRPLSFSQAAGKDSGKLAGTAPAPAPAADTAAISPWKDELGLTAHA